MTNSTAATRFATTVVAMVLAHLVIAFAVLNLVTHVSEAYGLDMHPVAYSTDMWDGQNDPGCVTAYHELPGEDPTAEICDATRVTVDMSQDNPFVNAVGDCLASNGYRGDSSDGAEQITTTAAMEWTCEEQASRALDK